jgi:hypothetical protein
VNRLTGDGLGSGGAIPILVHDAAARARFVIDCARRGLVNGRVADVFRATRVAPRAAARAANHAAAPSAEAAAAFIAARPGTVLVAVKRGQQVLQRSEATIAVRPGELAEALIARIAAIGRIADPFTPVDVAASAAAGFVPASQGQNSAVARARAAFAAVRTAFVLSATPDDGLWPAHAAAEAAIKQSLAAARGMARPGIANGATAWRLASDLRSEAAAAATDN